MAAANPGPGALTPAPLTYLDETPYSPLYGDIYHTAAGGIAQARHVFLAGNDLPWRWRRRDSFVIAETGFGLGLNFLATWQAWRQDPERSGRLSFVSFEKHPLSRRDLEIAHESLPELREFSPALLARWPLLVPGVHRLNFAAGRVSLTLFLGDAARLAGELRGTVDGFFLDGFDPARNPDLWSPPLLAALSRRAAAGATLATWCVAGTVRRALAACGWELEKRPGFAGKREMLSGRHAGGKSMRNAPADVASGRRAVIVGAGLAGSSCAQALASRGWEVKVIERAASAAAGASGNPVGVLRPQPSMDDNHLARLTRAGFCQTRARLADSAAAGLPVASGFCGALQLARDDAQEAGQRRLVESQGPDPQYLSFVDREQAARLAGWPVASGGWWFPAAGWVAPASLCHANLSAPGIELLLGREACRLIQGADGWRVVDAADAVIASAPVAVLANSYEARRLAPQLASWLRLARGQVNYLEAAAADALPRVVVCRHGFVTPPVAGKRRVGATFVLDDDDTRLRLEESRENLARLEAALPDLGAGIAPEALAGRAALRAMTIDRLPMVGALPAATPRLAKAAGATALSEFPRLPGLYGILGLGARGLVLATLAAERLASELAGEPLPLEASLVDALDPARFMLREMRRKE